MSYTYTPGLKIQKFALIRKHRMLPLLGEIIINEGDEVHYDTVVAKTYIPGDIEMIPLFYILGVEPYNLSKSILKKEGDKVQEDELLATSKSFFGLFKSEYRSKISGIIELISDVTGMIAIRHFPIPINLDAYISGKVIKIIPNQGVIIETKASIIQGIFGVGGERHGEIKVVSNPYNELNINKISKDCKGKIIVGGSFIMADTLIRAVDEGVQGIVTGSIEWFELTKFLGYEMGVAITGHEDIGLTFIITEGFGRMNMARNTYELLKSGEGKFTSINGATQIRAGVIRPEIIIPLNDSEIGNFNDKKEILTEGLKIGTKVRITRQPYFGIFCTVKKLPPELQQIETESFVRVIIVELENGQLVTIPRTNLEIVEE